MALVKHTCAEFGDLRACIWSAHARLFAADVAQIRRALIIFSNRSSEQDGMSIRSSLNELASGLRIFAHSPDDMFTSLSRINGMAIVSKYRGRYRCIRTYSVSYNAGQIILHRSIMIPHISRDTVASNKYEITLTQVSGGYNVHFLCRA